MGNMNIGKINTTIIIIIFAFLLILFVIAIISTGGAALIFLLIPIISSASLVLTEDITIDQLGKINNQQEYDDYIKKYQHSFVNPPEIHGERVGTECDVWASYREEILSKGAEIRSDANENEFNVEPGQKTNQIIDKIEIKCRDRSEELRAHPQLKASIKSMLKKNKIRSIKRSRLSRLLNKFA